MESTKEGQSATMMRVATACPTQVFYNLAAMVTPVAMGVKNNIAHPPPVNIMTSMEARVSMIRWMLMSSMCTSMAPTCLPSPAPTQSTDHQVPTTSQTRRSSFTRRRTCSITASTWLEGMGLCITGDKITLEGSRGALSIQVNSATNLSRVHTVQPVLDPCQPPLTILPNNLIIVETPSFQLIREDSQVQNPCLVKSCKFTLISSS